MWSIFLSNGTAKTDVRLGCSTFEEPSPLFSCFTGGGGLLNTETGVLGAADSLPFASVSLLNNSPNDFFSPTKAPKPPPAAKLLNPFALVLPRLAKADCPNAGEDAPKADLVSVGLGLIAGLPKTDGAPKVGFVEGVGVAGAEGVAASATGVLFPKTLVAGAFGGLKNGEFVGVVEPKAPKPESSFPNPIGDAARPLKAPPLGAAGLLLTGVWVGVVSVAVLENALELPKADVVVAAGVDGCITCVPNTGVDV